MKNLLLLFISMVLVSSAFAESEKKDSIAITILDRMSNFIGDLNSCSYESKIRIDENENNNFTSHFSTSKVYLDGPNKFLVDILGEKGHKGYWYNGESMVFYSYDENNYAKIEAPSTIMETIDKANKDYGVDFPAADFFYPTFTQDIIANSESIIYNGSTNIDNKDCFHITAVQKDMVIQIWVSKDVMTLPVKMLIMYNKTNLQYEATFSNWLINPTLPSSMFNFIAPPKSHKVSILPKN